MRFDGWMHKILMKKNVTLYCRLWYKELYYAACRFYIFHITSSYKAYFLHTKRSYIFREHFLLHALMTTYLKDLSQSIGRYGGLSWQYWFKGFLEAQVVFLLGAKNLASMRWKSNLNMLEDPWEYNFYLDIRKPNPLYCLPCPTSTF